MDRYRGINTGGTPETLLANLRDGILARRVSPQRQTHTITGGRFGGVTGAAADPLPQAGLLGGQAGLIESLVMSPIPS